MAGSSTKKQQIYVLMTLHMKDELGLLTFLDKLTDINKLIPGRNLKLKKSAPKGSIPYVIIWWEKDVCTWKFFLNEVH